MELDKIFEKFCEALPTNLNLTEEQKHNAFDLLYKLCYQFIYRDRKQN